MNPVHLRQFAVEVRLQHIWKQQIAPPCGDNHAKKSIHSSGE
ncbi:hypothetical protein [Spirosoma endbachense]|nr:hypothetical protein [Spirosoma endbachense]